MVEVKFCSFGRFLDSVPVLPCGSKNGGSARNDNEMDSCLGGNDPFRVKDTLYKGAGRFGDLLLTG
jgi:hypothetical protein